MVPTVASCQVTVSDLAVEENLTTVEDCVTALPDDVDLAVFPESMLTGLVTDDRIESIALHRDSEEIAALRTLATAHDISLVVGFVESAANQYYNTTAYLDQTGDLTVYRKRHCWGGEQSVLTPGTELVTVDTPIGEVGLLTCYDLNFVADSASLTREEITGLIVVGAWPAAYSENWRLLLRARALDGVRWTIGVNRTGKRELPDTEQVTYAGNSLVVRPDGRLQHALGRDERTVITKLDPEILAHQRELIGIYSTG